MGVEGVPGARRLCGMSDHPMRTDLVVRPATHARFDDVVEMLGPKKHPDADACWCLAYRLGTKQAAKLDVRGKRDCVEALCRKRRAPGVLAYEADEVVGWAAIAPRDELAEFADEQTYPRVGAADDAVWSLFCLRARAGHRKQGIGQVLIEAAVVFAARHGATVVEAYPLDTDEPVSGIFAYPGLRKMFERAGFTKVADTNSKSGGHLRILMQRAV